MGVLLSTFADQFAPEISGWLVSVDEAKARAGDRTTIPVEPDQFRRWHEDPDVHPFVAHENGELVACGELRVDQAEQEIELARIIVNPANRGVGIGRAFVIALVNRAAAFEFLDIFFRVLSGNRRAIRCYEAAGFATVPVVEQEKWNQYQPVDYAWLKYGL